MDPNNIDIFENLDTSLLEVFQQDQINQYLATLSPEERSQTVDAIITVFQQERQRQGSGHTYYEVKWYFNCIPLLILHYTRIWQILTLENIGHLIKEALARTAKFLIKVVRIVFFLMTMHSYFRSLINTMLSFTNSITFSDNFLKDLMTFVLHDNSGLMHTHELLQEHDMNIFYFYNLNTFRNSTTWQHFQLICQNYFASLLTTSCAKQDDNVQCSIDTDTLIFKLSEAVRSSFPSYRGSFTKITTVLIYLVYAIIGNIICLNILVFWASNCITRMFRYAKIVKNLTNAIWSTFFKYIA